MEPAHRRQRDIEFLRGTADLVMPSKPSGQRHPPTATTPRTHIHAGRPKRPGRMSAVPLAAAGVGGGRGLLQPGWDGGYVSSRLPKSCDSLPRVDVGVAHGW